MAKLARGMRVVEKDVDYATVVSNKKWRVVATVIRGLPEGYFRTDFPLPVEEQRILKDLFNAPWGVQE